MSAQGPSGPFSPAPARPAISRTLLERYDLPELPGYESRLYLIEYGPGASAPVHHHAVQGLGYVVSGCFESAFEGEARVVVREGQSFQDKAVASHTLFRNPDPVRGLRFVVAYVVKKGDPVVETP